MTHTNIFSANKVGNNKINISKDENLTRLLDSFHRDKPKGRRGVPSWNLSLVLHQLTKAPFELLQKASVKHLTFKTVFLLALGSGKRSEIHAWVHRNIRHQEDWPNVSLYPSPGFISMNHLAKGSGDHCGSNSYPGQVTKGGWDALSGEGLMLLFNKDIVPATVCSWIKQTIVLCYQLSDEQAQKLHQVQAHDVRAFAASKAFLGGVPNVSSALS